VRFVAIDFFPRKTRSPPVGNIQILKQLCASGLVLLVLFELMELRMGIARPRQGEMRSWRYATMTA
jgi:hypothetical protein